MERLGINGIRPDVQGNGLGMGSMYVLVVPVETENGPVLLGQELRRPPRPPHSSGDPPRPQGPGPVRPPYPPQGSPAGASTVSAAGSRPGASTVSTAGSRPGASTVSAAGSRPSASTVSTAGSRSGTSTQTWYLSSLVSRYCKDLDFR